MPEQPIVEENYSPPPAETVAVTDPEGREVQVTPKLYEEIYKGRGYALVDPGSYKAPVLSEPPNPGRQDAPAESITRADAEPLDPEQTGPTSKK